MDNASPVCPTAAMFDQGSPSPVSPLSHLWLWPPNINIRDSRSGVGTVAMFIFRGEQLGPGMTDGKMGNIYLDTLYMITHYI